MENTGAYEAKCVNCKTGMQFSKYFESPYLLNNFVRKCKYSKEIYVLYHGKRTYGGYE